MFGYGIDKKTLYIVAGILVIISLFSYGTDGIIDLLLSVPAVLIAMLLFAHIGWGKPVEIDPRNYNRNISVEKADAIVSFAGPLMNFITALIFALIYCAIIKFAKITFITTTVGSVIMAMVAYIITMNIGLGVFNLIPLPPLDGSKIFLPILPRGAKTWFIENERIFYIIFLVIWISGIAGNMISPLISKMTSAILGIALKIFGLA